MHPTGTTSPRKGLGMVPAGLVKEALCSCQRQDWEGETGTGYPSAGAWHKGGATLLGAALCSLPFVLPRFLCARMYRKATAQCTREAKTQ